MAAKTQLPPMGFIAVELNFHRPPGDAWNERTWPFPIIKRTAKGSTIGKLVTNAAYPPEFINSFVEAGLWLAKKGCIGLITSCGFLAMAQEELSYRLPIPIATSSLLQIPSIRPFLPPPKVIGVITFDFERLSLQHFSRLGIQDADKIPVIGCPANGVLRGVLRDGKPYTYKSLEKELVSCAEELVAKNPNVGVILLECTQLPVFALAIQEAVRLPVYDVFTMGSWFYSGLVRKPFPAWTPLEAEAAKQTRVRSVEEITESLVVTGEVRARL